jgi:hypothetical protein
MHVKNPGELGSSPGHCHRFRLGGQKLRLTNLHHSVPRDNRCCGTIAAPIEPVVQADAHDVGLLATSIDDYARAREWTDEGPSVAAEIGEEVLGLDAPIIEEGVFNTCTHSIADSRVADSVSREERRRTKGRADECVAEVSAGAKGYTACAVDEEAVKGDTSPAPNSREEARIGARIEEAGEVVVSPDGHVAIALDTKDEVVDLPVDAGLATDQKAAAVVIVAGDDQGAQWCRAPKEHCVIQWTAVIGAECAADIRADIEARPSEDRDRRDVGRRGRPARQIGGISRADHCRSGDRGHQNPA